MYESSEVIDKDKSRKKVIDTIEQKLENAIYMMRSEPLRYQDQDIKNVNSSFKDFIEYVENEVYYTGNDRTSNGRILGKIDEISEFFKRSVQKKCIECRKNESEKLNYTSKVQVNSFCGHIEELGMEELSDQLNSDLKLLYSNVVDEKNIENKGQRQSTIDNIKDLIENQMFQEIRGAFRYDEFENKEKLMNKIEHYLKGKISNSIVKNFDEVSQYIDINSSKLLSECVEEIRNVSLKKIHDTLESERNSDLKNINGTLSKENSFISGLQDLTNTDKEIVAADSKEDKNLSRSHESKDLPSDVIY